MFNRIITYNQVPKKTYYNEFNLSSFPIVSRKDMEKMLDKIWGIRTWTKKWGSAHISINNTRVSIRRVSIIMLLIPNKDLYFYFNWQKFICQDKFYIYDFKEYITDKIITMDNILVTPK